MMTFTSKKGTKKREPSSRTVGRPKDKATTSGRPPLMQSQKIRKQRACNVSKVKKESRANCDILELQNIECKTNCNAGNKCVNRKIANNQGKKLAVFDTKYHVGKGLFADEEIKKGDFIIEYTGKNSTLKKCNLWKKHLLHAFTQARFILMQRMKILLPSISIIRAILTVC